MGYAAPGSLSLSRHYRGGGGFTFVVFTVPGAAVFNVPAGVTAVDILAVGGGGGGWNTGGFFAAGGGGGGGVDEQLGVVVVPLEALQIQVGSGSPGGDFSAGATDSHVLRLPATFLAQGFEGTPTGINNGLGGNNGLPTGFAGGIGDGGSGNSGGGGGGAGIGGNASGANGGVGGPGADKRAIWGTTWGEGGFFGGGGGGGTFLIAGHNVNGIGHGANAGGGGFGDFGGGQASDNGIVIFRYAS